jgi:GGDEF domain-containing protein
MSGVLVYALYFEPQLTLKDISKTDPMTGILNRLGLEPIMEREVGRTSRHGNPLALIFFSLDDFKLLTDTHGHASGDEALVKVSQEIQPHLKDGDSGTTLSKRSEIALYQAKELGKNRTEISA